MKYYSNLSLFFTCVINNLWTNSFSWLLSDRDDVVNHLVWHGGNGLSQHQNASSTNINNFSPTLWWLPERITVASRHLKNQFPFFLNFITIFIFIIIFCHLNLKTRMSIKVLRSTARWRRGFRAERCFFQIFQLKLTRDHVFFYGLHIYGRILKSYS